MKTYINLNKYLISSSGDQAHHQSSLQSHTCATVSRPASTPILTELKLPIQNTFQKYKNKQRLIKDYAILSHQLRPFDV